MSMPAEPMPEQPEPERPPVEVVERDAVVLPPEPDAAALPARRDADLEHVTDAALAMPGVPGRDEFLALAMQARILAMSGAAPAAVRNNPYIAFHVAMVGRDLGISPSAALELIDVVGYDKSRPGGGDKMQLSLSPQLMNGQIRRLGLGSIVPAIKENDRCIAVALGPGGFLDPRCKRLWPEHVAADANGGPCRCTIDRIIGDYEFTWEDARTAGLASADCDPTEHTANCRNYTRGQTCQQGYKTYPRRMLWWRASGYVADDNFPEAGLGLYTAEELGAIVDADGRPLDPSSVTLPDGYEPAAAPHNPNDDLLIEAEEGDELHTSRKDLRARLDAIATVPDARAALVELWEQRDEAGERKTPLFDHLRRRHQVKVRALVKSVEDRITKGEWGDDAKRAWADAAVTGAGFGAGRERPQGSQGCALWAKCDKPAGHPPPCESFDGDHPTAQEPQDGPAAPAAADTHDDAPAADSGDEGAASGDAAAEPDVETGPECEACGAKPGSDHDARLHEMADAVADARASTRARAAQIAEQHGLELGLEGVVAPDPPAKDPEPEPLTGDALREAIVGEVKGLTPSGVRAELIARNIDVPGSPAANRDALIAALFTERTES